jgi:hypothetical protein
VTVGEAPRAFPYKVTYAPEKPATDSPPTAGAEVRSVKNRTGLWPKALMEAKVKRRRTQNKGFFIMSDLDTGFSAGRVGVDHLDQVSIFLETDGHV